MKVWNVVGLVSSTAGLVIAVTISFPANIAFVVLNLTCIFANGYLLLQRGPR